MQASKVATCWPRNVTEEQLRAQSRGAWRTLGWRCKRHPMHQPDRTIKLLVDVTGRIARRLEPPLEPNVNRGEHPGLRKDRRHGVSCTYGTNRGSKSKSPCGTAASSRERKTPENTLDRSGSCDKGSARGALAEKRLPEVGVRTFGHPSEIERYGWRSSTHHDCASGRALTHEPSKTSERATHWNKAKRMTTM